VAGDVRTWTWTKPDGKVVVDEQHALTGEPEGQGTWPRSWPARGSGPGRCPFIERMSFLSDPEESGASLNEPARTTGPASPIARPVRPRRA